MKINKSQLLELGGWTIFVLVLSWGVGMFRPLPTDSQQANAVQSFDHSQCQYPERTTNPVDGCDNSDPCDPLDAAKGGSGECQPVKEEVTEQDFANPPKPVAQCEGGK